MTPSEAMRVMENPSDYTVQERKDAKKVIAGVGSLGQDTTSPMRGKMPLPKSKPNKNTKSKQYAGGGYAKKYAKGGYANCGASVPGTQNNK